MSGGDLDLIIETYQWLNHEPYGCTEVRVIGARGNIQIAFVDNQNDFLSICLKNNETTNVYVGIQPRPSSLLERSHNKLSRCQGGKVDDVETVTATVIDIDPHRPKDTASTDAELEVAKDAGQKLVQHLVGLGYQAPTLCMSGNGVQLWFAFEPIRLNENRQTVIDNLKSFEAECRAYVDSLGLEVSVDSIHDLARIIKAIGTYSRKGVPSEDRPHRLSAPIGQGLGDRTNDPVLRERLLKPVQSAQRHLRVIQPGEVRGVRPEQADEPTPMQGKARRLPDGRIDLAKPCYMCTPVERLWEQGYKDRSLAIFNMMQWLVWSQLSDEEVKKLALEYDAHGGRKLANRDAISYINAEYAKIVSEGREAVKPPCHSLQNVGYCPVNREIDARCEIYDVVWDIQTSINKIPTDLDPEALDYRLRVVYRAMLEPSAKDAEYIKAISQRFGLSEDGVKSRIDAERIKAALDVSDPPPPPSKETAAPPTGSASSVDSAVEDAFSGSGTSSTTGSGEPPQTPSGPKPTAILDGHIVEDGLNYVTDMGGKRGLVTISSFVLRPKIQIEYNDEIVYEVTAECDNMKRIDLQFRGPDFESRKQFLHKISKHASCQWVGSDNNVQCLKRAVATRDVRVKYGTDSVGDCEYAGTRYFVTPRVIFDKDGISKDPDVIYVESGHAIDQRIGFRDTDPDSFKAISHRIFDLLMRVNKPAVTMPMLGWFFACPYKPRLMRSHGSFPTLWVHGSHGSGKTTLITQIFWPMFGITDSSPFSSNPTEFTLIKTLSQTSSVPIFMDEYKPNDQSRIMILHRILREHYSGDMLLRGARNMSVTGYRLSSPVVIAGESRPTEAAILERIVTSQPDKVDLEKNRDWHNALNAIRSVELGYFAAPYARFCLGVEMADIYITAKETVTNILKDCEKHVPNRIINNLSAMVLGILSFERFAQHCGYTELPSDLGIKDAVLAVIDDLVETMDGVKDPLDHFVETCSVMAIQGEIEYGRNYVMRSQHHVALHVATCFAKYREHCARTRYAGEWVNEVALKRLIDQAVRRDGYVIAASDPVRFGSDQERPGLVIDLQKLHLENGFPLEPNDTFRAKQDPWKAAY